MNKFRIFALLLILGSACSYAQSDIRQVGSCKDTEESIDATLQYLYRLQRNLPEIKDEKLRRLEFVESSFSSPGASSVDLYRYWESEMYSNPEYWQYKLNENAQRLVESYEKIKAKLKKRSIPDRALALAELTRTAREKEKRESYKSQINYSWSDTYFQLLHEIYDLSEMLQEHYLVLSETEANLERLGQGWRLSRALEQDVEKRAFSKATNKFRIRQTYRCAIENLNEALWR